MTMQDKMINAGLNAKIRKVENDILKSKGMIGFFYEGVIQGNVELIKSTKYHSKKIEKLEVKKLEIMSKYIM